MRMGTHTKDDKVYVMVAVPKCTHGPVTHEEVTTYELTLEEAVEFSKGLADLILYMQCTTEGREHKPVVCL